MRTTLNIDDEALAEVRRFAQERSISLGEAATRLICRGAVGLPEFKVKNGWALLASAPGIPPLTNETVKRIAEEDLDEHPRHAFPPGR